MSSWAVWWRLCGGVPVWKFGAQWASRNFLRPRKEVLIGDAVTADKKLYAEPFCDAMRTDEG